MRRVRTSVTLLPSVIEAVEKVTKNQKRFNISKSAMIESILLQDKEIQKYIKVKDLK